MATIALDLDGVTGQYYPALRDFIFEKETQVGGALEGANPRLKDTLFPEPDAYNCENWALIGKDYDKFKSYHTQAVDAGIYRTMSVMPGASEALWKLSNEGHHIYVVTSRFVAHGQNAKVISDTAVWLDVNNIPYRDIMFLAKKTDIQADVYIDDAPHNIEAFRKLGRNVVIFDAPYNRNIPGLRANDWTEAYQILTKFPV